MACDEKVPSRDEYWFGVARAVAEGSRCSRRKIGAVLVNRFGRIIAAAHNGFDYGGGHCARGALSFEEAPPNATPEEYERTGCRAIHAEMKALRSIESGRFGAIMYVTCEPCPECARVMTLFGVSWKFP